MTATYISDEEAKGCILSLEKAIFLLGSGFIKKIKDNTDSKADG